MNTDWNDPLWEAEFERGKIYQARVTYLDGTEEVALYRYIKPQVNTEPVNGLEYLIMPEFVVVSGGKTGHAKSFEVIKCIP